MSSHDLVQCADQAIRENCPFTISVFGTDNELQTSVENLLKAQAAGFYGEGIRKLVPRYEKCLCRSSDYVEK